MPYAMSVIVSRAIPEIDGFKPSHRKLLVHHVQNGAYKRSKNKVIKRCGTDNEAQSPRRRHHIRNHGPSYGRQRFTSPPFRRLKGKLRQSSIQGIWLMPLPRYTEAKAMPESATRYLRDIDKDAVDFVDNLRCNNEGACTSADRISQHTRQSEPGHCRRHGKFHLQL